MNKYLIKESVTKMVPAHCLVNSTLGNTDKRINLQDKLRLLTAFMVVKNWRHSICPKIGEYASPINCYLLHGTQTMFKQQQNVSMGLILSVLEEAASAKWTDPRRESRWFLFGCPDKKC